MINNLKNIRQKTKTNSFRKKIRRRFPRSASGSDSSVDEYADDNDLANLNEQDSTPSEGYYWPGKDYANTYKADFKELHDFSSGFKKKCLINTQFLC